MGSAEMLAAMDNREQPDHDTFTGWLRNRFDPEAFDEAAVDKVLRIIG